MNHSNRIGGRGVIATRTDKKKVDTKRDPRFATPHQAAELRQRYIEAGFIRPSAAAA